MCIVTPMAPRPHDPVAAWPAVVRATGLAAVLVALAAGALHYFAGVGAEALLIAAAVAALVIGSRLPAAAPAFLQPADETEPDELATA
jgi:hypothetical protein